MSYAVINQLVRKDWYFNRWTIAFYLTIGVIGLLSIRLGASDGAFYVGSTVLLAATIGVGIHLIMATIVIERSEQNLPFTMSLPVTPLGHTAAKIIANLSAFGLTWIGLLGGSLWLILSSDGIPNGLVPLAVILLTEIFVAYCIMLGVAIVSESEGLTILAVVLLNIGFNFFLYGMSHLPAIAESMTGPVAVWNRTAVTILALELSAIPLIILATLLLQARKRDFL